MNKLPSLYNIVKTDQDDLFKLYLQKYRETTMFTELTQGCKHELYYQIMISNSEKCFEILLNHVPVDKIKFFFIPELLNSMLFSILINKIKTLENKQDLLLKLFSDVCQSYRPRYEWMIEFLMNQDNLNFNNLKYQDNVSIIIDKYIVESHNITLINYMINYYINHYIPLEQLYGFILSTKYTSSYDKLFNKKKLMILNYNKQVYYSNNCENINLYYDKCDLLTLFIYNGIIPPNLIDFDKDKLNNELIQFINNHIDNQWHTNKLLSFVNKYNNDVVSSYNVDIVIIDKIKKFKDILNNNFIDFIIELNNKSTSFNKQSIKNSLEKLKN